MIHLVDNEDDFDAEEERLRVIVKAQQSVLEDRGRQEQQRRLQQAAEVESDSKQKQIEAAEFAEKSKQAQRSQQARSEQSSQVQYRIAPDPDALDITVAAAPPAKVAQRRSVPVRGRGPPRKRPATPVISDELAPDGFEPLHARQPSMFDSMALAPGVGMGELGRSKIAPQASGKSQMTRKEYLSLCAANAAGGNSFKSSMSSTAPAQPPSPPSQPASPGGFGGLTLNEPAEERRTPTSSLARAPGPMTPSRGSLNRLSRAPAVGVHSRDLLQRSMRPAALSMLGATVERGLFAHPGAGQNQGVESSCASPGHANGVLLAQTPLGGQPKRLSGSRSGGTIVANRDLLRHLFQSAGR